MPPDKKEAARRYRRAAEKGYSRAQFNLGVQCAKADGVPINYVEAFQWLALAAGQNHPQAAALRDAVTRLMTPQQIAEAQQRVSKFTSRK